MCPSRAKDVAPTVEPIIMVAIDSGTARCIGIPRIVFSTGTYIIPPPIPMKWARKPEHVPAMPYFVVDGGFRASIGFGLAVMNL